MEVKQGDGFGSSNHLEVARARVGSRSQTKNGQALSQAMDALTEARAGSTKYQIVNIDKEDSIYYHLNAECPQEHLRSSNSCLILARSRWYEIGRWDF